MALARLLLEGHDLLLLDEPTNHLDAESVQWLERYLADFAGTVVTITHDRYFLEKSCGWILELERGEGKPFEGCIEMIDIGGPTMVRAAAKNCDSVAIVTDTAQYADVIAEMKAGPAPLLA